MKDGIRDCRPITHRQKTITAKREDYISNIKFRGKMFSIKKMLRSYFMARVLVSCQLYCGEEKYPSTTNMTVRKMGKINRKFRILFCKELDKDENTKAMLWTWKIKNYERFSDGMLIFSTHFLGSSNTREDFDKWIENKGFELENE